MKRAKENKNSKVVLTIIVIIAIIAIIVIAMLIAKKNVSKQDIAMDNGVNIGADITTKNDILSSASNNEITNTIENKISSEAVNQVANQPSNIVNQLNTKPVSTGTSENKTASSNKTGSQTPTYKNSGTGGLPVLMYHFFYNAAAGETPRDNNFIEISAFENQMKYLSDNNFYFPTWQEVEDYIDGKKGLPAKSIVITVDDGDESFFRLALPVIEKYNVKATEFLVTSWNGWYCNDYKSSKVSYQSHSDQMHKGGANGKGVLLSWSYDQIYKDLTDSKNCLNGEATVFCYPFGQYNETSKKILKDAGYKLAFTTQGGRVYKGADKYALPRVRISKGISLQSFANMVN